MHSPVVVQHVSDRAGFDNFKTGVVAVHTGSSRTQQAFVTMLVCLLASPNHCKRILGDSDLLAKLVQSLDQNHHHFHSVVLKGKVYLLLAEMCARSHSVLLACCEQRLVMYMERDSKRVKQHALSGGVTTGVKDNQAGAGTEGLEYLHQCLVMIVTNILKTVPQIQQGLFLLVFVLCFVYILLSV